MLLLISSCQVVKLKNIQFPEGGYPYAKHVLPNEQDFYFYPVRDVIPRKDSVLAAIHQPKLHKGFDEPNLSLRPPKSPIFRLTFEAGLGYIAFLTLTPDSIIVKEIRADTTKSNSDEETLNSLEKEHLRLLGMHYLMDEYKGRLSRKRYLDSLTTVYPQLLDPRYYLSLLHKEYDFDLKTSGYRQWTVAISKRKYRKLVTSINQSGYWKMKYLELRCPGEKMHPSSYSFEAATPDKYQVVIYMDCKETTSFQRVMKALMKKGGLDKSIKKWQKESVRLIGIKLENASKH
jgi:hypothetical protein